MTVSWTVRSVRAAMFAVVCMLLAAGGHTLATGSAPPVWADAVGFLPVFAGGVAFAGRERSLLGIGLAMLFVQGGLHLGFDAAGRPATPMDMPGMPHGMHMAGQPHAMTSHAVAAHLAAALVCSWCLRRGEAALYSLLRKAVAFVPGLAAWRRTVPLPEYAGPPRSRGPLRRPLRQALLRHALSRRGPPLGSPYRI